MNRESNESIPNVRGIVVKWFRRRLIVTWRVHKIENLIHKWRSEMEDDSLELLKICYMIWLSSIVNYTRKFPV